MSNESCLPKTHATETTEEEQKLDDPLGCRFLKRRPPAPAASLVAQDKTGDGQLDKDEFWRFIQTIGGIPPEASAYAKEQLGELWRCGCHSFEGAVFVCFQREAKKKTTILAKDSPK